MYRTERILQHHMQAFWGFWASFILIYITGISTGALLGLALGIIIEIYMVGFKNEPWYLFERGINVLAWGLGGILNLIAFQLLHVY